MKNFFFFLFLALCAKIEAQTKVYKCGTLAIDNFSMNAQAEIIIDEQNKVVDFKFTSNENLKSRYKIVSKSSNAKIYKITDEVNSFFLYVVPSKNYEYNLYGSFPLMLQIETADNRVFSLVTYFGYEQKQ